MLRIYTDGSCKGNGQEETAGGWAYAVVDDENNVVLADARAEDDTTNNRMEMKAVIYGVYDTLNFLEKLEVNEIPEIHIYTDSAYIHNCMKQEWYKNWMANGWMSSTRKPVKNKDLWKHIIYFFENDNIIFHKVKGHADDKWNNYVDALAQKTAEDLKGATK